MIIKGYKIVPKANLRKADLRGADLRGADLWGADLRGTDLQGADLREADLRGADLREADLRRANLWGADLWGADLRAADLREADLRGADLRHCFLTQKNSTIKKAISITKKIIAKNIILDFKKFKIYNFELLDNSNYFNYKINGYNKSLSFINLTEKEFKENFVEINK